MRTWASCYSACQERISLPKREGVVAEATIATRDIDQLTLGQKVDIRFSAFDQRSTPERKGGVVSSPDVVTEQCSGVD